MSSRNSHDAIEESSDFDIVRLSSTWNYLYYCSLNWVQNYYSTAHEILIFYNSVPFKNIDRNFDYQIVHEISLNHTSVFIRTFNFRYIPNNLSFIVPLITKSSYEWLTFKARKTVLCPRNKNVALVL